MVCFFSMLTQNPHASLKPVGSREGVLGRAPSKTRLVPYRSLGLTSNRIGCGVPATHGLSTKLQALALLWPGDPLVLIPLGSTGTKQAPGAARLIIARAGGALLKITARYLK